MSRNLTFKACCDLLNNLPASKILNDETLFLTCGELLFEIQKIVPGRLWIIAKLKEKCFYYDVSIFQLLYLNKINNN